MFGGAEFSLADAGTESEVQTLRSLLQHVESAKQLVDYSVGGHSCARPPQVQQGVAPDGFNIEPDTANPVVWRPQAIQVKNLKGANIASTLRAVQARCFPIGLGP